MTMATSSEILEGTSHNNMLAKDRYRISSSKISNIVAKSKNIITHGTLQGCGAYILQ